VKAKEVASLSPRAQAEISESLALQHRQETAAAARLANAAYVTSGSDKDRELKTKAQDESRRAMTLHKDAVEARVAAVRDEGAAERARLGEEHQDALLTLPLFGEALEPLADRLIAIDRELFNLARDVADAVALGARQYDEAAERARVIGSTLGTIPRPSLADAILELATTATTSRSLEGREDCSELLAMPSGYGDWRQIGMSAETRAAIAAKPEPHKVIIVQIQKEASK
jgi:hypothetical protein